jgi:cytochrome c oxidase cbb3-type subunit 3
MAEPQIDPISGQRTTGHEWDGIQELHTPIPTWWITAFLCSVIVALLYAFAYPSWPSGHDFYRGFLGWSSHGQFAEAADAAQAAQAGWRRRIAELSPAQIEADDELRRLATAAGRATFLQNCAPCHGRGAAGQVGQFPSLIGNDWIWGGRLDDIYQTVQHGIRNEDPESRNSAMPVFGEILPPQQIEQVADYVLTLADPARAATRAAMPGADVFAQNCAPCHGPTGHGGRAVGAPNLAAGIWHYGGTREAIIRQVTTPRMGVMPSFGKRLGDVTLKLVAVYIHTLGGGEP